MWRHIVVFLFLTAAYMGVKTGKQEARPRRGLEIIGKIFKHRNAKSMLCPVCFLRAGAVV